MNAQHYEEAIPFYEKAVAAAQQAGAVESEARNIGNMGLCYYNIGDFDKAMRAYQKAEAQFEISGNSFEQQTWLNNIGEFTSATSITPKPLSITGKLWPFARGLRGGNEGDASAFLANLARTSIETGRSGRSGAL